MITVRAADIDDVQAIVGVYLAAWREGFRYMFPASVFAADDFEEERRIECTESILHEGADTYVAEHSDRVVGYLVARSIGADSIIDDVWVNPASGCRGVATALVARAEDDMRSRGGRALTAWVPEDSPSGRRFFDKLGWRPSGRIDVLHLCGTDHNQMIEYQRQLQSVDLTRGIVRPTRSLDRAQPRPVGLLS